MVFLKYFKKKQTPEADPTPSDSGARIDQGLTIGPRLSSLSGSLFHKLAGKASFLERQQRLVNDLEKEGHLIFAVKYRSQLDFLFLHSRLSQAGLQPPVFAFDMRPLFWLPASKAIRLFVSFLRYYVKEGSFPNPYKTGDYRELILREDPSVLFLVGKTGYYRRVGLMEQDPLHLLIETQRQMEKPIILVPSLIFHGKAPEKQQKGIVDIFFGQKHRPGSLRKLMTFLRNYKNNVLEVADPLNVKNWLAAESDQSSSKTGLAFQLRRELIDRIDRHRRVVTGPVMKSRWK